VTASEPVRDFAPDGTPYVVGPRLSQEASLPPLSAGLPGTIDTDTQPTVLSRLAPDTDGLKVAKVGLVYLRPLDGSTYRPVLVRPDGGQVEVDEVTLHVPDGGNAGPPLGAAAIDKDGRRIVFAQPGEVVLVDAGTGEVIRNEVPDPGLRDAGWTTASAGIVTRSASRAWYLHRYALEPTPLGSTGHAGHYEIVAWPTGDGQHTQLRTWNAYGHSSGAGPVTSPATDTFSDTVGNLSGWAAAGVFLDAKAMGVVGGDRGTYQAILAVQGDELSNRRMLVFTEDVGAGAPARTKACCRPLGWLSGHELLFQSRGPESNRILVWDITTGHVRQAATLTGANAAQVPVAIAPR
jgi:hypothetical protein